MQSFEEQVNFFWIVLSIRLFSGFLLLMLKALIRGDTVTGLLVFFCLPFPLMNEMMR